MKKALFALPLVGLGLVFGWQAAASAKPSQLHRVVIDVSSGDSATWQRVLNNVENLQRQLGTANTFVEVVAYGPGLGMMLQEGAPDRARMEALARGQVVFVACQNTLQGRGLTPDALLPFVRVVPSGAAELVLKQEAGWSYLKPGM
ncbi:DsrE family protein [bacterium]|nr:DsrE family protein [bacterium]